MRVATFNVENLFSRPTILNREDHDWVAARLAEVAELSRFLQAQDYAPHAARIKVLYLSLKPYITINIRSSEVGRYIISAEGDLIAGGAGDWVGFVDLKRERFSSEQVRFTGKVIDEINADIQCLVEVEDRNTLGLFNTDILKARRKFTDRLVVDGNDPRGIDVALASKRAYPVVTARTNAFARDADGLVFSRDCLEVTLTTPGGEAVHVLVNHFKAKDRKPAESNAKRLRQATFVAGILKDRYDLSRDFVIVAGDLNDEPGSAPLAPLHETAGLTDVFDVVGRPADDRWTYYYAGEEAFNTIDYLFVSDALKPRVTDAGIERRGIAGLSRLTNGDEVEFDGITSWRVAASDHGAVWADFDMPD